MLDTVIGYRFQSSILHPQARIARVELLDLLCDKMNLPKTIQSYKRLQNLHYQFGQKLVREGDGKTFWATDYNYTFETSHKSRRRRDIVLVKGTERKRYLINIDEPVTMENALCGEAVFFLKISDLGDINVPPEMERDESSTVRHPTYTFILVRYFEPDPIRTFERDPLHRPLCTGPLHINHCLWRYSQANIYRKVIATDTGLPTDSFHRHKHMFGKTHQEQLHVFDMEKKAYHGLIPPSSVVRTVCMCPCFLPNTSTPDYGLWMETVTVL